MLIDFFQSKKYEQGELLKSPYFCVQDVLFNSVFIKSIQETNRLVQYYCDLIDDDFDLRALSKKLSFLENKTLKGFNKILYDNIEGRFLCKDFVSGKFIRENSVHSLIPLILDGVDHKEIENALFDPDQYYTATPIPSTSIDSEKFDPVNYWRGPVWPIINWLICRGLLRTNRKEAFIVARKTLDMISEGFGYEKTLQLAMQLHEFNTTAQKTTTPSRNQYKHAWLWDSCFASIGWQHIKKDPGVGVWPEVFREKQKIIKEKSPHLARKILREKYEIPLFYEYFAPVSVGELEAGSPLGSDLMTWTASVFIDLHFMIGLENG
jgi:hypothetical protein